VLTLFPTVLFITLCEKQQKSNQKVERRAPYPLASAGSNCNVV